MDLVWHDFLEIGVEFIDEDHRRLLRIMRDIRAAIEQDKMHTCIVLLHQLQTEARAHFQREELFLQQARYPGLEEHKQYHRELLQQADTTRRLCEGTFTEHDLKACFDGMAKFLIDDILGGDIRFKSYLEDAGYMDHRE